MIFAEVNTADLAAVRSAVDLGTGGIFLGTAAVGLLQRKDFGAALAHAQVRPFVSVDEEGGRVQRLTSMIGSIPSARDMHATMTPPQIAALAENKGKAMRRLGLTMNFAPDADVSDEPDDAAIGDRSFSNDPHAASADAVAFAKGMLAAGVTPVFKHFPGHGHGTGDSHTGLVKTPPLASLRNDDLVPYRVGLPKVPGTAVMVGHLIVPGLTGGQPASVSHEAITGLLRDDLGFDGLVITDDLGAMAGILDLYSTDQAAVRAAEAGADLLLVPESNASQIVDDLVAAVHSGHLSGAQITASANQILRARNTARC